MDLFLCVCMYLAKMLTKFLSPSQNTFGLAGFERGHTEVRFFSMMQTVKKHGFGRDKTSMPRKLKDIFVGHSASTKYLSCAQSSYPVEKIS